MNSNNLKNNKFFSEEMIKNIREKFYYPDICPYTGKRIYFESAGGSLRLKNSVKKIKVESSLPDNLKRASKAAKHVEKEISEAANNLKIFSGIKTGQVMPSFSATHGIYRVVNAVVSNCSGSNVITTNLEHSSMYDATNYFAKINNKEWRVAELSPLTGTVPPENIISKIDENTCLLGIIHASNITGGINKLKYIIKEAKLINPDIFIIVDGVQYVPHELLDLEDLDVDAYIFSGYKIFTKKGFGFGILSKRISNLPHWRISGSKINNWDLGSIDNANYSSWSEVVDYISWLGSHYTEKKDKRNKIVAGMKAISSHTSGLLEKLIFGTQKNSGLLEMGHINLIGIDVNNLSNRICLVGFNIEGINSRQAVLKYEKNGIRLHYRTQGPKSKQTLQSLGVKEMIRFSACHYNTIPEINKFLEVTANF